MIARPLNACRLLAVTLATLGIVLPTPLLQAADPVQAIPDIALDAHGTLLGTLVDAQGQPQPQALVALQQDGQTLAQTRSDAHGRFAVTGLRGGVYLIVTEHGALPCRAWTAAAAPPSAGRQLLVPSDAAYRGQYPISDLFIADPILLSLVIAAAIAIPIAVHNSKSDSVPGS